MLDAATPINLWTFTAQTNDDITLRALGQGIKVRLALFASDGGVIAQGDSVQAIIPTTGIYTIEITREGSGDAAGTYDLGLSYTNQPNPSEVPPTAIPVIVGVPTPLPAFADLGVFIGELAHGTSDGSELSADTTHVYTFNGQRGQYATLEVRRVFGELDPLLTLYSPQGTPLALDANSGENSSALVRNVQLAEDGIYTVQVSGRGLSGAYAVSLALGEFPVAVTPILPVMPSPTPITPILTPTLGAAIPDERLQDHLPVLGELADASDVQRHSFQAYEGEIITFSVLPLDDSSLIPRVELYDPEGVPVAAVTGNADPANRQAVIRLFKAEQRGAYSAFVTAEGQTFGAYIVSYGIGSTSQNLMRGEADVNNANSATLQNPSIRELWYANLQQGDVISASIESNTLDTILELVTENGDLLGLDANSGENGQPIINGVTIPRNGVYFFRVRALGGTIKGDYTLTWRYLSVAPTATPPAGTIRVLSITDTVPNSVYQFYPFQGRANQTLRLRVLTEFGSTFDPVIALLDNEGKVIAEGDDIDGSLNPTVYVTLPADGTYTVRVNGYLQGGTYELVIEELIPTG
jgi:hypothetical protein